MKQRNAAYTPNMDTPSRKRGNRALGAFLLTLLLPPVGVAYLWRRGVFRSRGRVLLTALATLEMALVLGLTLPRPEIVTEIPVAAPPAAATVAPDDGVVTALSNMEQIIAEQQAKSAALEATPEPVDDETARAAYEAEQQAILNTTVYSVFNNAKYYHSKEVCGTQSNRRALTVQEALNENMGACKNCNPPIYLGPYSG